VLSIIELHLQSPNRHSRGQFHTMVFGDSSAALIGSWPRLQITGMSASHLDRRLKFLHRNRNIQVNHLLSQDSSGLNKGDMLLSFKCNHQEIKTILTLTSLSSRCRMTNGKVNNGILLEIVDHVDIFGLSVVVDWSRRGLISAYQCIDHSQTRVRSCSLHSAFFNFVFASTIEIA
jgi:hypothetical protein